MKREDKREKKNKQILFIYLVKRFRCELTINYFTSSLMREERRRRKKSTK